MNKSDGHASNLDHIKSILALPFVVLVIIPGSIQYLAKEKSSLLFKQVGLPFPSILGLFFLAIGLFLFIQSIRLFIKIGKGTLAPWNPTKKLVVKSLYRYVRNPMILGVLTILIAESLLLISAYIFVWAAIFFFLNHIYFQFKEEPDLVNRFGEEYLEYKQSVSRWLPRIKAWRPEEEQL